MAFGSYGTIIFIMMVGWVSGCDSGPSAPVFLPGLEVITPQVGITEGQSASLLIRSNRPSRVSVIVDGLSLGAGRSDEETSALNFVSPVLGIGETSTATLVAISESGGMESVEFDIVGLGYVNQWSFGGTSFNDVVAAGARAVLSTESELYVVSTSDTAPRPSGITAEIHAITSDGADGVLAALVDPLDEGVILAHIDVADELTLNPLTELAPYEGSSSPVERVNALHADETMVGAATDNGMSIVDLSSPLYCRKKSAETVRLSPAIYIADMQAVMVTAEPQRLISAGAYLNIYEASEIGDPGGCEPVMPNWGTSVIANPLDNEEPWSANAMIVTDDYIWISVMGQGILAVERNFHRLDDIHFADDEVTELSSSSFPLSQIVDLAPSSEDRIWVALRDSDEERLGGIALVGLEGVELWVGGSIFGGIPRQINISSNLNHLWALSGSDIASAVVF